MDIVIFTIDWKRFKFNKFHQKMLEGVFWA